ncbi:hypothetical protein [Microbacterium phyllosphaerae]|uniref:hypothetical protein n=1 Tax=Microbacterium phyllosphaerae TaxID=124798 RepID=UPI001FC99846|nr:hypothetical protein [Microbacterium phyllosphaerae]
MHTPSMRLRPHGAERMLIIRIGLALGLALLLVIGAWSTSHGKADAHTTLCLAPGISAASASDHHDSGATVVDAVSSDTGTTAVAALCCILLVLLFLRVGRAARLLVRSRGFLTSAPTRAGPRLHVPALTLTQLSLSRT